MNKTNKSIFLAAALLLVHSSVALAQSWPPPSSRIVIGNPAGGPPDTLARLVAQQLGVNHATSVIVENKVGGALTLSKVEVFKGKPDGSTIGLGGADTHVLMQLTMDTPFRPIEDFRFISKVATVPNLIVAAPNAPYKTLKEMVEVMKAKPGQLYATSAAGSALSITALQFFQQLGVEARPVPFPGAPPIVNALLADEVPVTLLNAPPVIDLVKAGKLRALATTTRQRLPSLPDVPTIAEAGFPNVKLDEGIDYVFFGPATMSEATSNEVYAALEKVLNDKAIAAQLENLGFVLYKPAVKGNVIEADLRNALTTYAPIVKQLGIAKN
jgi:tripartite-type tricarboxylate transporter receptor subunit TctC